MDKYVVCFDYGYDNNFIEVDATNEKDAIKKAKELYIINYGRENLYQCNIDAEKID